MNDADIVSMLHRREEAALKEAGAHYRDYCFYIAGNILRDERDREEAFSDMLMALWKSVPPQNPSDLKSYMGKLMRGICIDKWRAGNAKKRFCAGFVESFDELESAAAVSTPEDELMAKELSSAVSAFLRTLPQTERAVFIRRYWYYDPISAICEKSGFGKSKVKMMLKRTRGKLAEYLKKEGHAL